MGSRPARARWSSRNASARSLAHVAQNPLFERRADSLADACVSATWPGVRQAGDGAPLDPRLRAVLEPRLGHDFGRVRIFADDESAGEARSVGARAFTIGEQIHFGAGELDLGTRRGRHALAHELAHVEQQSHGGGPPLQRLPPQQGLPPQQQQVPQPRPSAAPVAAAPKPAGPLAAMLAKKPPRPRGPNPAPCMTPFIEKARTSPDALKDPLAYELALGADFLPCLRAGAPASNARFGTDIVDNLATGFAKDLTSLDWFSAKKAPAASDRRAARDQIVGMAERRREEARVSFHYDVLFTDDGTAAWSYILADWRDVDAALAAVPDELLWDRSTGILRLQRSALGPPSTTGVVGGETVSDSLIKVFNAGLAPYTRSAGIQNMPPLAQTLRHELGHYVMDFVRKGATDGLFALMGWVDFAWHWVSIAWQTAPNPTCPAPGLQNERCDIADAAGFTTGGTRDWVGLDAFLSGLTATPTVRNGREWAHERGGNFVSSRLQGAVPSGPQWSYASTNKGDYFSELFAFALSDPEFVHREVPAKQVAWLKTQLFDTPGEIALATKDFAVGGPSGERVLSLAPSALARVFTRQQIRAVLSRVLQAGGSDQRQVA